MKKLYNLLGRKKHNKSDYDLREYDWSNLKVPEYTLDDIMSRKIDGVIVHNALAEAQIQQILAGLRKMGNNLMDKEGFQIFTYPETFFQLAVDFDDWAEYQEYFQERREFWQKFKDDFTIDLVGIVSDILGHLAGGKSVDPPPGTNNQGFCNPLTIRAYPLGDGHLATHCDRSFHYEYPAFFSHLREVSNIENQLSYFITLQTPEIGGKLILYHIEWKEAQEKVSEVIIKDLSGKERNLENERDVPNQSLQLRVGDLIVFPGSHIWHSVSKVKGTHPRITAGGFITRTKDQKGFYIWS